VLGNLFITNHSSLEIGDLEHLTATLHRMTSGVVSMDEEQKIAALLI